MIRKEGGRIMRVRTRDSDRVGRRSWIPFKQWERRQSNVVSHWEFERWARSSHLSSSSIISLKQTSAACILASLLCLSAAFLSLSRRLSLAVGQWICVRAMTGDQTRAVSVWQRVWTRFLCVSVWNNTSGCVREQLSKEFYSVFLSETCVSAAHWVSVWEHHLCTSIFRSRIQRQNYEKAQYIYIKIKKNKIQILRKFSIYIFLLFSILKHCKKKKKM